MIGLVYLSGIVKCDDNYKMHKFFDPFLNSYTLKILRRNKNYTIIIINFAPYIQYEWV